MKLAKEKGLTFVHPFDDLDVATGQGSIAMEIIKELPTVDYILVPIGGGGLATGVSTLAKLLNPNIKVIGVEPAGANCLQESLKAGKVVTLPTVSTIADGTAVKTPGSKLFPYLQKNLDDIITVPDEDLIVAFLDMVENHKMIVENSGLLTVRDIKADLMLRIRRLFQFFLVVIWMLLQCHLLFSRDLYREAESSLFLYFFQISQVNL